MQPTARRKLPRSRAFLLLVNLPALAALAAIGSFASLTSCGGGDGGSGGGRISPAALAEAREIFKSRCSTCHGDTGAGDGPGAAALDPKPRDFRLAEWQKSVTDEHIKKAIVLGGAGVGKSPLMVPNPDLKGKDDVLNALVWHVRSLAKK